MSERASRRRVSIAVVGLVALLPSLSVRAQETPGAVGSAYDPKALRLLGEMADAYGHLKSLRQETSFVSAVKPLVPMAAPPAQADGPSPDSDGPNRAGVKDPLNSEHKLDRKLRLAFSAPNRLRLEIEDTDDNGKVQMSVWVSDGKTFWTYNPDKNLFSREKAPKKIHDFSRLAHMTSGSLEILMLMGIDPFGQIDKQAEAVSYSGQETVRGVATDVVTMMADLGPQSTETKLYIGADDHLLYRLVSETSQKPKPPERTGVGSPLDELAQPLPGIEQTPDPTGAPTLPGVLMKSRITCDNSFETEPRFVPSDFSYEPPAGAFYLTNPAQEKPMTWKQRMAELTRAARRKKGPKPKVYRF